MPILCVVLRPALVTIWTVEHVYLTWDNRSRLLSSYFPLADRLSATLGKHDLSDHSPSDQVKHEEESVKDTLNREVPDPEAHLNSTENAAIVSASTRLQRCR
jgi:hypothetical protein